MVVQDYTWVTHEMFDKKLVEIVNEHKGEQLLAVPGVYEVLSEHFNNAVLDALDKERDT